MVYIFHTCLPGWDLYDLDLSHIFAWVGSVRSAGSAIFPRAILTYQYLAYHTGIGIIIGTRTVRLLYEIGATYDMTALGDCQSWFLVAAGQARMRTLPNATSTQSRGAEAKHKHCLLYTSPSPRD